MRSFSIIILAVIFLNGCHTIHIKNGPVASYANQKKEIHHIGIFDLVEYSRPVNLELRCSNNSWDSVTTRTNVWQVFLGLAPYVGAAWSPEEVGIVCKKE